MTTHTTEEAMAVLKKYRGFLIQKGRWEAYKIAQTRGAVHCRQVRARLDSLGLLNDPRIADHWLGAVFRCSMFQWTGEFAKPDASFWQNQGRNFHDARPVKVWELADGADFSKFFDPDPVIEKKEGDPMQIEKADLKEFTVEARVFGPTRSVSYVQGDTLVNEPALVIRGITAADAWQILGALDTGLFESDDPVLTEEKEQDKNRVPADEAMQKAAEPEKKKKKRRTKAEIEADKEAKLAAEEKAAQEKVGAVETTEEKKSEKKNGSNGHAPSGYDLEQFKSATGLSSVVRDLAESGVDSCDAAVAACLDLQKNGVPCLKGVNIERRVPNIWARVAS